MKKCKVNFNPGDQFVDVPKGTILMKAIRDSGIDFDFPCGGVGRCGKCRIQVLEGMAVFHEGEKDFLDEKERDRGIHLACFTEVQADMVIELLGLNSTQHKILLDINEKAVEIKPHIVKKYVTVEKPKIGDNESEWQRFRKSIFNNSSKSIRSMDEEMFILYELPQMLRKHDYSLTAITYENKILGIEEGDTTDKLLGMAFDIGTTSIAGYLIDLHTGKGLSVVSDINPQTKFGADVISRSNYAYKEENGLEELQSTVIRAINRMIKTATKKANVNMEDIYLTSFVGNTCMHHLFLGLSPEYISKAPYIPTISDPLVFHASTLNIRINPVGKALFLPNIAGFVGADTVGAILATDMDKSNEIKLMIDIGTNGEMVLGSKEKLYACSTAAGPAFEGAQISSGMRGAEGAIDYVTFGDSLEYSVIGNVKPKGICGSGLLDVVAGLLDIGIINKTGRFLSPEKIENPIGRKFKDRVIVSEDTKRFLLVDAESSANGVPILITQKDIRQLQLAKGAIASGIKILMAKHEIDVEDITEVFLAGAFGNYLNPHSACRIGLIPKELEGRITAIGNAAGVGAKSALLSSDQYKGTVNIANLAEYVELASFPNFSNVFAKSMYFE